MYEFGIWGRYFERGVFTIVSSLIDALSSYKSFCVTVHDVSHINLYHATHNAPSTTIHA